MDALETCDALQKKSSSNWQKFAGIGEAASGCAVLHHIDHNVVQIGLSKCFSR
jgi:hypothetical protein